MPRMGPTALVGGGLWLLSEVLPLGGVDGRNTGAWSLLWWCTAHGRCHLYWGRQHHADAVVWRCRVARSCSFAAMSVVLTEGGSAAIALIIGMRWVAGCFGDAVGVQDHRKHLITVEMATVTASLS